jgi:hypothetical protein
MNWVTWLAILFQLVLGLHHARCARRAAREWVRLRALNQIVWSYTKELAEKGIRLPPRCVMCCQILPRHVEGCSMQHEYERVDQLMRQARIKYYPKGEHPPHPEEEPPHA